MPRSAPLVGLVVLAACIVYSGQIAPVPPDEATTIMTPVKAHLVDGSTAIFRVGVTIGDGVVRGEGVRYSLSLAESTTVDSLALDSLVAMEVFRDRVEPVPTALLTTLGVAGTAAAVVVVAVAVACATNPKCFGSCPTVYSDSAGRAVLEAEGFSYSIARLFETRDVDALRADVDSAGVARLEIRNEALETHFINHVELLAVEHDRDERALPDGQGRPVVFRDAAAPRRAVDRAGRDVRGVLSAPDGILFQSDSVILARTGADDLEDHIDLEFAVPPGADSVALVLRLRNSLLATVLLYDLMLGDRGPQALSYLADSLEEIGHAVALGRFAHEELGMRVAIWREGAWHRVARLADTGPVAWKDVVVVVPAAADPALRVRLSFVTDNWRFDRVAATAAWRRASAERVPVTRVVDARGSAHANALASIRSADDHYLETRPGQYFIAEFDAARTDVARTFFLAWQGHYTEWVRRAWLERGGVSEPFAPGRAALAKAVARWRTERDSTERLFYATRVPVR